MCFNFCVKRYEVCALKDPEDGFQLSSLPEIGWDTTRESWKRDITYSGHAYAIKDRTQPSGKRIIGTITSMIFDEKIRIMDMIIHPDHQGKKLGTRLLKHLIKKVDPNNFRYLELESTVMGKPLYEKFGFKTDYEVASYWKNAEETKEEHSVPPLRTKQELQEVVALDKQAFGASRSRLLKKIAEVARDSILIDKIEDNIQGFVIYTKANNCVKIGPWMHQNPEGAERLMKAAMINISNEFPQVKMTVSVTNEVASKILENLNFNRAPYIIYHMHKGNHPTAACNRNIYHGVWSFGVG